MAIIYNSLSGGTGYSSGLQLVDEVLSTVAKQYRPDGFLYDQIVAPMQVVKNSGQYPIFDPGYFFQTGGDLEVADDAETPVVDFKWSVDHYHCKDKRLSTKITRKDMTSAAPELRLDFSKTIGLLGTFALNREYRLAAKLSPTATLTPYGATSIAGQFTNTASTPSTKWDASPTSAGATIQNDLQAAALVCYKASGKWPNTLVINKEVALAISQDFLVRDTIKYLVGPTLLREGGGAGTSGGRGILPDQLYGFNVLVADGTLYNSARPGQVASLSDIWGNSARLIYTDPNAQWGVPATVYSFRGRVLEGAGDAQPPATILPTDTGGQEPGGTGGWALVDRWWVEDPPHERIRVWENVDEKVVAAETGVLIPSVLGSY